ncbi:DUF4942 domain-containing protein [Idiomarina abyssalis]|uniref:DUF4942 domain-containing protein n=1 Tax=Idiomarina abyssalis TaxID=86102 RepID=A0A8I1GBS2_9GAMM|nr:DUF4942 domain-containing protein [Idiomarina abyssalis]MBJ7265512.1 DUF4942 domain-containing protein [Idiomarina abyssalis]MBJ7316814.1 DUF4942 domain-containing protein [Idiomarina abyssalis]
MEQIELAHQKPLATTNAIVTALKEAGQDKEFYPTTDEIIDCITADLTVPKNRFESEKSAYHGSILDVGCGDGRVLEKLTQGPRFGIEQSHILIDQQSPDIITIGTDFHEQTLLDKKADVTFSNPPYSEFAGWAEKIIRESMSTKVYLVLPRRWKENVQVQRAIKLREATTEILGSFDFMEADRKARAVVDVIKVKLGEESPYSHINDKVHVDPFTLYFNETFEFHKEEMADEKYTQSMDDLNKHVKHELSVGRNYIDILEERYQADLNRIFDLYQSLTTVDLNLLHEIGVNTDKVASTLKHRMETLKNTYWKELFTNFDKVTERLTQKTRTKMLGTLQEQCNIDFTAKNAHAIVSWVVRQANSYFDSQLDNLMRSMISFDCKAFVNYKSNQRTFVDDGWRYSRFEMREEASHFKFDYRVVLTSFGGMDTFMGTCDGISDSLVTFINDLLAVASTVGFDTSKTTRVGGYKGKDTHDWEPGQPQVFTYYNHTKEKELPLFRIKAFKNQNAHIQFDQNFILALNVAMGRINGWLKTKEQAAEELGEDIKKVAKHFAGVHKIESTNDVLRISHAA